MITITLTEESGAFGGISNHDLATLADWAAKQKQMTPNPGWKSAFALIREGADTLLRRRARATVQEKGEKELCG